MENHHFPMVFLWFSSHHQPVNHYYPTMAAWSSTGTTVPAELAELRDRAQPGSCLSCVSCVLGNREWKAILRWFVDMFCMCFVCVLICFHDVDVNCHVCSVFLFGMWWGMSLQTWDWTIKKDSFFDGDTGDQTWIAYVFVSMTLSTSMKNLRPQNRKGPQLGPRITRQGSDASGDVPAPWVFHLSKSRQQPGLDRNLWSITRITIQNWGPTLQCHQTWLAGTWTKEISDFPS